ncbi:glycosyltransferase family A protein [Lederbergia lenta]|uniref:Protein CgeD n=1 Tax=Lederbergia lenta TaxID=1467 RepID=A0A2X4ZM71_LEDLE|nr:glycosyltransferase family A protein [Lederbergia lenta]MCM3113468.1 glycosyltransferase family 2 protein [Lederbergia lenta]MEC2326708.1 glycosyltransferase family A protein [Lederbergia lenta]SQI61484.1 protein CgeD [Lederbergia lenta]
MSFNPKVTVIMTSYNKPELIGIAIKSVLDQSLKDFELLIMDDNSNMETINIIKEFLNDPRVTLYKSDIKDEDRYKKTRYATLINQALELAKGEYISYITDDNMYKKNRLDLMSYLLNTNKEVNIVYSAQKLIHLNENYQPISSVTRKTEGVLNKAAEVVDHCSVMHRKSILDDIKKKYGNYWDDDKKYWGYADAIFWNRLNEKHLFYPTLMVLDYNYRTPRSYKVMHFGLPSFEGGECFIPNGTIVKDNSTNIYYFDDGKRRLIKDPKIFNLLQFTSSDIIQVPDPILFKYTLGKEITNSNLKKSIPNDILIKSDDNDQIYYIQKGKKRPIQGALHFYGFKMNKVITLPKQIVRSISNGPALIGVVKKGEILPNRLIIKIEHQYYLVLDNCLHLIGSLDIFEKLKLNREDSLIGSKEWLQWFNIGPNIVYEW